MPAVVAGLPQQVTPTVSRPSKVHDVCIIGAGPHGLAVLSALHSPAARMTDMQRETLFRKDKMKSDFSVCVVDGHPWLAEWHKRFEALGIKWLRSPAKAHPGAYEDALIEFAHRTGRASELRDIELHSECLHPLRNSKGPNQPTYSTQMRGLGQAYTGMYALPTQALFRDFCAELAETLPHDFVQSRSRKIMHHHATEKEEEVMEVLLENGARVWARKLVLAVGAAGPSVVPSSLESPTKCTHTPHQASSGGLSASEGLSAKQLLHSSEWHRFHEIEKGDRVLVVGEYSWCLYLQQ